MLDWARTSHDEGAGIATGDVSELPFEPLHTVWKQFSVSSDECKKNHCIYKDRCFANAALEEARQTKVIVTNYHMLFAHLSVFKSSGLDLVLPPFEMVVMDECFVAGTMVGDVPIESVRVGDVVPSFDENTGQPVDRTVRRLFVSRPTSLLAVTIGGERFGVTPGHPFLTVRGWTPAASLNVGDRVLSINYETKDPNDAVRRMRQAGDRQRQRDVRRGSAREGLLFGGACATVEGGSLSHHWTKDGEALLRHAFKTHEGIQSDARSRDAREGFDISSRDGLEASRARRQRDGAHCPADTSGVRPGVALRSGGRDEFEAASLQDRRGERSPQDRNRDRRLESLRVGRSGSRPTKGSNPGFTRVDRVEVLERGSDGTFGGVCPDGLVYNLEVEGTHTYLVGHVRAVAHNCHKAADIAREFFGFKITVETVRRLGRRAAKMNPVVGGTVDGGATLLFRAMSGLKNDPKRYKARLTGDYTNEERDAWYQLSSGLTLATKEFSDQVVALTASVNECARRDEVFGDVDRLDEKGRAVQRELKDLRKELGNAESDFTRCVSVHSDLGESMDPKGHLERVYFLEEDEKKRITMSSKYVDVGQVLNEWLFNKVSAWRGPHGEEVHGNRTTVIATSATIATNGTSFDYIAKELGVPNGYHELVAQSPFDWQRQCLFIVPGDMPEPNAPEFRDAVARTIERAILLAGGRTLALFTSRRVLEHTYDVIYGPCARNKINVLKQGQEPRTKLITRFKEDVSSVLLGTESFWAGVDVPGEACSVVIIDRLPFPTPDDPVLDVLSSRDRDWFFRYSVPRAMIAFKQGFGRSVRSSACHKVVICLDARLSTKRYGRDFLRSLPPGLPKTTRLDALVEWLRPKTEEPWDAL